MTAQNSMVTKRVLCSVLVLAAVTGLSACGNKDKKSGQSLAVVNGEEITVHQLSEELQRAGVQPAQQEAASKQLLESLVDRQLLVGEAARDKTDRDPKVMQAIERAKSQIIAQAYIQKRLAGVTKPTKAEAEEYYKKNPQFFAQRKQFDMRELIIASKDFNDTLKVAMDAAITLDEVKYARSQLSRSTSDLPPEMTSKLLSMPKTQLFLIREGERTLLLSLAEVKDSPVTLETATPQIEQFLYNKKNKEAADSELARLRAAAKIEYLNKVVGVKGAGASAVASASASASAAAVTAPASATAAVAASATSAATAASVGSGANDATQRGISGLK
jgi:EpsD family peptidyl-prolyl cis-trans isomerase